MAVKPTPCPKCGAPMLPAYVVNGGAKPKKHGSPGPSRLVHAEGEGEGLTICQPGRLQLSVPPTPLQHPSTTTTTTTTCPYPPFRPDPSRDKGCSDSASVTPPAPAVPDEDLSTEDDDWLYSCL